VLAAGEEQGVHHLVEDDRRGCRRAEPANSMLRNPTSKGALWITSLASPQKAAKLSTTSAKSGLSARKASERPWTASAPSETGRSGLT